MELMLHTLIIIFMIFLCSLCLFAVIVIARDLIRESNKGHKEEPVRPAPVEEVKALPIVAPQPEVKEPEPEPVAEVEPQPLPAPVPVEEVAATADDGNSVAFSTVTQTMEEKYAAMSSEYRRYFDDIIKHALSKEGVKEFKHNGSYDYKIGSYKVLRLMIKRSEIVCEFHLIDRDFRSFASASNIKMKSAATSVRVTEPAAVGVVKDGIDLVCTQIEADKAYKKELAREKRREKRKQAEAKEEQ
ncbi:MAG: hypothetical protein IJD07_03895 [Clostridia bacterium]|nr:hypothetical protein [Clostridia bacterium]